MHIINLKQKPINMSKFWEIKTLDYYWTAIELKQHLPMLDKYTIDNIVDHLRGSGIHLIKERKSETPKWIRFTLPIAFVTLLLMLLFLPIHFMFSGSWNYENKKISNWFRAVGF